MSQPITAEALFARVFLPLYPADAARNLAAARRTDANPAANPNVTAHLAEAAAIFVEMAPVVLGAPLTLDYSDASVHHLSRALTRERRDRFLAEPSVGTPESTLFNFVVHGAAYLGECIVRTHAGAGARWLVRRPLWESMVALRTPAGDAEVAVFHVWLKSLADDALDGKVAALADRYRAHVEEPTRDWSALPRFLTLERKTPRLAKVRYDAFYKYLRAHFPEIRDVGDDFPSAARFDELGLRWLDAHVVGDGRMALFVGAGDAGVHLYWLDQRGFVKGAFIAADKFPEPVVRVVGDRLTVVAREAGAEAVHETFWWGP